jgi:hypothetical protein
METFERFIFTELSEVSVVDMTVSFDTEGLIHQSGDYCYLNIDDRYVHQIFPVLAKYGCVEKPDYFTESNAIGAHISVIYSEEMVRILPSSVGEKHDFSVSALMKVQYGTKDYFVLSVTSPSLSAFRQLHYLSPRPIWKGQEIMFHITVGVRDNSLHCDEDV